jgi:hypothetical protein
MELDPEAAVCTWRSRLPKDCPSHQLVPYAMKAYALHEAAQKGHDLLLWADASILPIRSLEPLWERIERDGYWFSSNGYSNYTWTADSQYCDLFEPEFARLYGLDSTSVRQLPVSSRPQQHIRETNQEIPHVVATAFGLNLAHHKGREFLAEYYRLASQTRAFCGPWMNSMNTDYSDQKVDGVRCAPCGPPDVKGSRHDQTCASVLAWRLGFELTNPPDIITYGRMGEVFDTKTILVADGSYV